MDEDKQVQRLMERNGYNQAQDHQRIAAQMPLLEKKKYATLILDNNGSLEDLQQQVRQALKNL